MLLVGAGFALVSLSADPAFGSTPSPSAADELNWSKEREFWSFRSPTRHSKPAVTNKRWPRQPLDYFVLDRVEAKQLVPAPEAGRQALIRRLSFDLIGLPPTPEQVEAFLADTSARAYERLVERLLASRQFGEHMASLWLPLVRYAEDQAHQVGADTKYFYPNAWRYRAWVIDSFNRDFPYDRFLKLQLAADRLEGTNSPNLAALGFLGLGPKYYNRDRLEVQADEWEDRVDTVSRAMLGLTVACARCHDHKFDPITMGDYYAMAGVFASTRMVNRRPDGTIEKNDAQITNMSPATVHMVEDGDEARNLPIFLRGNVARKGPVVERRFLQVLSTGEPPAFEDGSGRPELARAIADGTNPLTARVMVNRVWGQFFGRPLVSTPSNFGHSGQPPTHPELLDDLAVRFMEKGWSVKGLVREMVLSATYRQDSTSTNPRSSQIDPANELLSHMNRRRLSIEQWRDAILFASGELEAGGGPSAELDDPANRHRTVYARISRLKLNDLLMQFDYPDANVHAEKRSVTTTAIQKLFVLNSDFMRERARALAARLNSDAGEADERRVVQAYRRLFGRKPMPEESSLAREFLGRPSKGEASRWEQYAQMLLASNEMAYVD
jgi:hypothetical protein